MFTLPNILTLSRMALLPVMVWLFFMETSLGAVAAWWCLGLYVLASVTDFFDGYLARKLNQVSEFGTFLDPISDKIFVGTVLVLLVGFDRLDGVWVIPVLLIFLREFLVSGLREFLGPKNIKMPVTNLAKWKTTAQMIALGFLIVGGYVPYAMEVGHILICVAAYLTLHTGFGYVKTGLSHMKN